MIAWRITNGLLGGIGIAIMLHVVTHVCKERELSAVTCAGTLWLGNSVYMYLSVAFIQMLKALMPVAVFATGCLFGIEKFKFSTLANMVSC